MGKQLISVFALNRGLVSPFGIARTDQARLALSAEIMTNWMPRVLGSMALRPGFGYIGPTASNAAPRFLPFVFSTTDVALIELTNLILRVWVNDALITRAAVTSAITNGTFAGNITSWTVSSGNVTYAAPNQMQFVSDGTVYEYAYQTVTTATPNVEHALRIGVNRGPILLRVGSTVGGQEYISETTLGVGTHSLAFTPTGSYTVYFLSSRIAAALLASCVVESAGVMTLPVPWITADLGKITVDQSGDIVFVACVGYQQMKIERRATRSWSTVLYQPEDGPFMVQNTGPTTIAPSATTGDVTLTASAALFKSTNVGSLYQLVSEGQRVDKSISAQNTFSNPIQVTGVGESRRFTIAISGTWVAVITLQRSIGSVGTWEDINTYSANDTTTFADGLDNQVIFYRIGVKTGDYTSGTVVTTLSYTLGTITGVVRITAFSSTTSVSAAVLTSLGGLTATDNWSEGSWSDRRGWPGAVALYEGRLWWAGKGGIWGSISDAYDGFDPTFEGDAGPINRVIGSGPVDTINWLLGLQRLIIGAQGAEISVRSSSLDEPLTPNNFNMKTASTQGSAAVNALKIDTRGVFVQRGSIRIFELATSQETFDYGSDEMTTLVPELASPGIVRMAVQRQPDTRMHYIRSDGTVMMSTYDKNEKVLCFFNIETDGDIEDVVVLPSATGSTEDQVYYAVKREINGSTVRYLEKWAKETECRGSTLNKQADSFVTFTGSSAFITGLDHLEGEEVIAWADGVDLSPDVDGVQTTFTVTGGQIDVGVRCLSAVAGLPYEAQWQSTKLGVSTSAIQSALTQQKILTSLGLILAYVHPKGLQFGADFDHLNDMPSMEQGSPVPANTIRTAYDEQMIPFPGKWTTDMRLCMLAKAPRPVTVLAAVIDLNMP